MQGRATGREGQQARRLPPLSDNFIQLLQDFLLCPDESENKQLKHLPNKTGTAPARRGSIVEAFSKPWMDRSF